MRIWVSRDSKYDVNVWGGTESPIKDEGVYTWPVTERTCYMLWEEILPSTFKANMGFTPRKGTCKQYELTLKEIKQCG